MRSLLATLREDWDTHGRGVVAPGFHAVAIHRVETYARSLNGPVGTILGLIAKTLHVLVRNFYGIEVPAGARIGRRVQIAHQSGIVVSKEAVIGDDCSLRQNVTIGVGAVDPRTGRRAPTIEPGVYIGAGAVIVGGVTVGTGAVVGANALVMTDVPPGATAYAKPAGIMKPPAQTGDRDGALSGRSRRDE